MDFQESIATRRSIFGWTKAPEIAKIRLNNELALRMVPSCWLTRVIPATTCSQGAAEHASQHEVMRYRGMTASQESVFERSQETR